MNTLADRKDIVVGGIVYWVGPTTESEYPGASAFANVTHGIVQEVIDDMSVAVTWFRLRPAGIPYRRKVSIHFIEGVNP